MHSFDKLVQHCTQFTLSALGEVQRKIEEKLKVSATTPPVKALQMIQMQKVISAVGMFSIFEAILQDELQSTDGFRSAGELLEKLGEVALKERFNDLHLAINVLKHGRGRSYDALVMKSGALPFRVKLPDEVFFSEGDVAEVSALVEVDDAFLLHCVEVIGQVSLLTCARGSHAILLADPAAVT